MEFRLLGPVELWHRGQRVELGPARQCCVLAALILNGGQPVPAATLVNRVWDDDPPARARDLVYTYVARLRAPLRTVGLDIRHRAGAYALDLSADAVDARRFEALVCRARGTPAAAERLALLREALGLWRSTALQGLSSGWVERTREHLERQRLGVLVDRFELELALGRHLAVVDELSEAVLRYPAAEALAGQLMVALHRAGRQTEALKVFRDTRAHLVAELGLEPGAELRRLERAVLDDDPGLSPSGPATGHTERAPVAARGPGPVPAQLPAPPTGFVGRDDELRTLRRSVEDGSSAGSVVVITGPAGVGKTALALRWCWSIRERFPDGQIHLDLRGFTEEEPLTPATALDRILRALGVPAAQIPAEPEERAARLRSQLADRKVLLMLDNAATARQVRSLLPGGGHCLVVVTSRNRMDGLVATQGAIRLALAPLSHRDATTLVRGIGGLGADGAEALDQLVTLCDRLPLALRVVAARLDGVTPLDAVVRDLQNEGSRLGLLAIDDDDVSVRQAVGSSVRRLDAATRRMFGLLGLHPGPTPTTHACAALAGPDTPDVRAVLDRLTAVHLVQPVGDGHLRLHDLVRLVARELSVVDVPDAEAALLRVCLWYRDVANAADRVLRPAERPNFASPPVRVRFPDATAAMDWLDGEAENLVAAAVYACGSYPQVGWQISAALYGWLVRQQHVDRWIALYTVAVQAAARAGDRVGEALIAGRLAIPLSLRGRHDEAATWCQHAYELRHAGGDVLGAATALVNLAAVHNNAGRSAEALSRLEQASRLSGPLPDAGHLRALIESNLGEAHEMAGRQEHTITHYRRALVLALAHCAERDVAEILLRLARAHRLAGQHERAVRFGERAVDTAGSARDVTMEIRALEELAMTHAAAGNRGRAAEDLRRALTRCDAVDHPRTPDLRKLLDSLSGP